MKKICYLVPAHNEAKVIKQTLRSLLAIAKKQDIYVVDDHSSDQTRAIALQHTPNVLTLSPHEGKAEAMNRAISYFSLTNKYKYIMPLDADTLTNSSFVKTCVTILDSDLQKELVCVVGRVEGSRHNWLTFYRMWEYEIAQTIHKSAQREINSIIVCPGCATIYRTSVFHRISFPAGTITEDMDFTFSLHRQHLGRIFFTNQASVVTQDPNSLSDYIKQITRWYTGFWQCVFKHRIPWLNQTLDLEVALLASEGIFNGLLMIGLFVLIPLSVIQQPEILLVALCLDLFLFMIPSLIYVAVKKKLHRSLLYLPLLYLVRVISSLIFLISFFKVVLGLDITMKWVKPSRYQST